MIAACYKSGNNNDKFDNNKDKDYLLLKRWVLMNYMLDHMLDHVLDQMLDHMLDHIITGLMTTALHQIWVKPLNKYPTGLNIFAK